jgi:hypothetical protein
MATRYLPMYGGYEDILAQVLEFGTNKHHKGLLQYNGLFFSQRRQPRDNILILMQAGCRGCGW